MNKIIIDVREKKIKEYFTGKSKFDDIVIQQLDLGDIIFMSGEEVMIIIERKTIQDLRSSIKDGRHREQKIRLLSNFPKHKIYYLIEGDILHPGVLAGIPEFRKNINIMGPDGEIADNNFDDLVHVEIRD